MGKGDYKTGQTHGSKGNYKPPFSVFDSVFGGSYGRDSDKRRSDYAKGYSNGKSNPKR